jgi:acetyltransferase
MDNEHLGCSKFANLGNMIDVSFGEILDYFSHDPKTDIICLYLEAIPEGREFYERLKTIIPKKPVIALKGGRSSIGMKAVASHTGSIASNYKIIKSAIVQAGGVLCESIRDYATALKTFAYQPVPNGNKIGVITNSGACSVLFSDRVEQFGLKLASFSEDLKQKINPHVIPLVKKINPLDMIAGAREEQYHLISKILLEDPDIDIVVGCTAVPTFLEMKKIDHYRGMITAWNETGRKKPLIPLCLFADKFIEITSYADDQKAPVYYTPFEAAYACRLLIDRMKYLNKLKKES